VIIALLASTAIEFQSWYHESHEDEDWTRRRLDVGNSSAFMPRTGNSVHDRTWRGLVRRGFEPGTATFNNRLQERFARRERERDRRLLVKSLTDSKEVWLRGNFVPGRQGVLNGNTWRRDDEIEAAEAAALANDEKHQTEKSQEGYQPFTICDRPTDVNIIEDVKQCPLITEDKPILLIKSPQSHGRAGNNILEFLHALQQARDQDLHLGIMGNSWAMHLITKYWLSIKDPEWVAKFEEALCVKVFLTDSELEGYEVIHAYSMELLHYRSNAPLGEYIESQEYYIRTLFRHYNTGEGVDRRNRPVEDMCSGIKGVFGEGNDVSSTIYSVIHSRSLEGEPGRRLLASVARKSGCDRQAALLMEPEYVKSILEPLGMMHYPIVFISDGQDLRILQKLKDDPQLGPLMREVPGGYSWIGGDMTLGIMSNVFIGNPASTFAGIIAKTRLAFGFGHSHLYRAQDEHGQWREVCGDHCVYDKSILGVMA